MIQVYKDTTPAHQRMETIRELLAHVSKGYLLLGKLLKDAETANDYKALGYEKMTHYVADYFGLKQSRYYQLRQVYDTFGHIIETHNDLQGLDFSRLRDLLSIAPVEEEKKLELLYDAKTLTSRDFRDKVRVSKGKVSQVDCEHNNMETYRKCKTCGYVEK